MSETAGTALRRYNLFQQLLRGPFSYSQTGHTLILGWSQLGPKLISELVLGQDGRRKPKIVILSAEPTATVKADLLKVAGAAANAAISVYLGDASNAEELERVNLAGAKSIVILNSSDHDDLEATDVATAVIEANRNPRQSIVVESKEADTAANLAGLGHPKLNVINADNALTNVMVQSSRGEGLAGITLDLLDFAGDEIYFANVPALAGKTYADAVLAFGRSSVIGLRQSDGSVVLNPAQSTKLTAESRVIAISQDEHSVVYTGVREDLAAQPVTKTSASKAESQKILVVGWSPLGDSVLRQLDGFVGAGSTAHVVYEARFVQGSSKGAFVTTGLKNIKVTSTVLKDTPDEIVKTASVQHYDQILVLAYRHGLSKAAADAETLRTLDDLRVLFGIDPNGPRPSRVTAELRDAHRVEAAAAANPGAVILSDHLASLLIAQLSTSADRSSVFDQLFATRSSAIAMYPIENYTKLGEPTDFGDVVAAARNQGQSAIGYWVKAHSLLDPMTGVLLNPAKNIALEPSAGDKLIVIG